MTDIAQLPWLPTVPEDFRARCKTLDAGNGPAGADLIGLAVHGLDLNKLTRLAKSLAAARDAGRALSPLRPFRLGLLSNGTTDLLTPALEASALRHGIDLEVIAAPFDQAMQQALDPTSAVQSAAPDAVLLAFDHRAYGLGEAVAADPEAAVGSALERIAAIREGFRAGCGASLIVQTLPLLPEPLFGSFDARMAAAPNALVAEVNRRLAESGDLLFDAAGLAARAGLDRWHDPVVWHLAKLPCTQDLVPLYADGLGRLIGALRGTTRKCLVLDLDNTLWGGVIGDDGLDGIEIGQGTPRGEAFLAVQNMALTLRARGIVLAVCSKNDDAVARLPFREHPDMALKEDHIAVFQANWTDKPTNLRAIAEALNIGTDALVFLEDNPAERAIVRRELPEVAVPEVPDDPALYPRRVLSGGWFEAAAFSEDDRQRAAQYRANARRAELASSVTDIDGYLDSLGMVIRFAPFDGPGRARIAQLINKSNQFNLTTRRYTEDEVAAMQADPTLITLQVRLSDSFGDNGMISVVIGRPLDDRVLEIDTWLMSCRVLGRRVEQAVLNRLADGARERGVGTLRGRYLPTDRNALVAKHYEGLGFALVEENDGETVWDLHLDSFHPFDVPMTVEPA